MKTFTNDDTQRLDGRYEKGDTATAIFDPAVGVFFPTYLTPLVSKRFYVEFIGYVDEEDSSLYVGQSSWESPGITTGPIPGSWLTDIRILEQHA